MNSLFFLLALLFAITQASPVPPPTGPDDSPSDIQLDPSQPPQAAHPTPADPTRPTSLASVERRATSDDSEKFDEAYRLYLARKKAHELFKAVNVGPWPKPTKDQEKRDALLAEYYDTDNKYYNVLNAAGLTGSYGSKDAIEAQFKALEAKKEAEATLAPPKRNDALVPSSNPSDPIRPAAASTQAATSTDAGLE
jgi:hypothetical protein